MQQGDYKLAYNLFKQAVDAAPGKAGYRRHLAQAAMHLAMAGDPYRKEAMALAQSAAMIEPETLASWVVLGNMASAAFDNIGAIAAYERALGIDPTHSGVHCALGHIHMKVQNWPKAYWHLTESVRLQPDNGLAHYLLSTYYVDDRRNVARLALHGEKGMTCPDGTLSKWNAANGLLSLGHYLDGFEYFEARHECKEFGEGIVYPMARFPNKPVWCGEPNVRVHVHPEQGMGDSFQFCRYLPMIKDRGCIVTFESRPEMFDLMQYNFALYGIEVVPYAIMQGQTVPEFDFHIPLMSLPRVFKTTVETVPWDGPYIAPEPDKIFSMVRWYPKIGICWAGEKRSHDGRCHQKDGERSMAYEDMAAIMLRVAGIEYYSLQLGSEGRHFEPAIELKSWSDTAALIHNLDMVISVDTAVIHLAGAMGKPCLLLDKYDSCWRWLEGRDTSPWYPTMKIIRQKKYGDWSNVVQEAGEYLANYVAGHGGR